MKHRVPFYPLGMPTSQILQWSGWGEASGSNWEPQAVQIGSSFSDIVTSIEIYELIES